MTNHDAQLAIIEHVTRQESRSSAGNCQADYPTGITHDSMNLAEKIALISIEYGQDNLGEWTETQTKTEVFAMVNSVTMSEFYNAGLQGFKPDYRFSVWMTEYDDQELVEYKGKVYSVYRTYRRDDGRIELYTEERTGESYS